MNTKILHGLLLLNRHARERVTEQHKNAILSDATVPEVMRAAIVTYIEGGLDATAAKYKGEQHHMFCLFNQDCLHDAIEACGDLEENIGTITDQALAWLETQGGAKKAKKQTAGV